VGVRKEKRERKNGKRKSEKKNPKQKIILWKGKNKQIRK